MFSIWENESFFAPQDVIIVGSGFTGLWSAYCLKRKHPRLKVTIIDGGNIPAGASTRNAGFACFGSLSEVVADVKSMGIDKTVELVKMRYQGLEKIERIFRKGIDFEKVGGYELYGPGEASNREKLESDIQYINPILKSVTGEKQTYRMADEALPLFGFGNTIHLVKNDAEGYLHSGKLVQALLHLVQGLGVSVLNGFSLNRYEKDGSRFTLHLSDGLTMKAEQVLLCTNAFTKTILPDIDIEPARGQVLLTSPIEGLPWKGTFHADEGYYYFRNLGNRVLLGGARNTAFEAERSFERQPTEGIQGALQTYLDEVILPSFRGQYTITDRWAGIMGMGSEKMPIVKELSEGLFCAVRMSGMGVALAPVVAKQVARMMR